MTTETHERPFEASPAPQAPATMSWREKRYWRRRRRVWFEEVLGWILVPVILLGCYWLLNLVLGALGTSPAALIDGVNAIMAHL